MSDIQASTETILEAGIWHQTTEGLHFAPIGFDGTKADSHKFAFTPEPISMPDITEQMHSIAAMLPSFYTGVNSWLDQIPHTTGVSSQYKQLTLDTWPIPPVTMLDGMLTADGEVKIAEVDVINPRGLGYLALYSKLYDYQPGADAVNKVAETLHADTLDLYYGQMQGFYEPYFALLAQELEQAGIQTTLVPELQADAQSWDPKAILDFPLMKKVGKKSYGPVAEMISEGFNSGDLQILYPPQPQLSSKLLLSEASANGVFEDFLPATQLVENPEDAQILLDGGHVCIKAAISSGMHGLWMPGDTITQPKPMATIAQQLVADQHVFELVYASGESQEWETGKFLGRVSMFVAADGRLVAADLTAQPYDGSVKGIHGNPDCVLTPITI